MQYRLNCKVYALATESSTPSRVFTPVHKINSSIFLDEYSPNIKDSNSPFHHSSLLFTAVKVSLALCCPSRPGRKCSFATIRKPTDKVCSVNKGFEFITVTTSVSVTRSFRKTRCSGCRYPGQQKDYLRKSDATTSRR